MKCALFLLLIMSNTTFSQSKNLIMSDTLPYYNIPDSPNDYGAGNIVSRMIDGLGYRYYWATEGLMEENLNYKPSEDGRTIRETLVHIMNLSRTTMNATSNTPNIRQNGEEDLSLYELRRLTLNFVSQASTNIKGKSAEEVESLKIIFERADRRSEFPFWNLLNGPLADAMYHTGQVVAFRRAAGNPVSSKMNVFTGKTRD